jgi:hypothetical protein
MLLHSSRLEGENVAYTHAFMATRRKSGPAGLVNAIDPGTHAFRNADSEVGFRERTVPTWP